MSKKKILYALIIIFSSFSFLLAFPKYTNAQTCNTGDGDGNGTVDGFDYVLWWQNFNQNVQGPQNGDFDCSGYVDGFDYVIWWQNFGINPHVTNCLTLPGPLITLSGSKSSYRNSSLANKTKIDATNFTIANGGERPVRIGGGSDICWHSGKIYGGYPLDTDWHTTHPTAGISVDDGTVRFKIEGVYIDQIGDAIKVHLGESSGQSGITEPFIIKDVWLRDIRDDCIESDWQAGAIIQDSLFEGCYAVFATKKRSGDKIDGSNNVWEIRNTLAYMHDQIGVYSGQSPGHSMFFKWDETSPKWKMYDSILRVDSAVSESSNQFNFRTDKLADCANNILVWLGPGDFPEPVPSCFTITKDKSVWDNAVADWKNRH